jgi:hypothetical protein
MILVFKNKEICSSRFSFNFFTPKPQTLLRFASWTLNQTYFHWEIKAFFKVSNAFKQSFVTSNDTYHVVAADLETWQMATFENLW